MGRIAALPAHGAVRDTRPGLGGHSRWFLRRAAIAAAVCALAVAGWWLLGSPQHAASAFDELSEAIARSQAAEWLHGKGTVAGQDFEGWFSMRPFRAFVRRGERVEATDAQAHREYAYDPEKRTVTVTYVAEAPAELQRAGSLLGAILAQLEGAQKEGLLHLSTDEEVIGGRKHTVYTVTVAKDGTQAKLTVDASAQRLVRMESQAPQGPCSPGPFRIEFDYPQSGPTDIYAIGVPHDARVVENLPTTDLLQLHERVEQARGSFARSYRALIWLGHASRDGGEYQLGQLVVVYKRDGRYRLEWGRQPEALALPGRGLEDLLGRLPPDNRAALEKWAQQVPPREVYFNENSIRSKGVRVSRDPDGQLRRDTTIGLPGNNTVEDLTWSWPIYRTGEAVFAGKEGQFGPLLGTGYDVQGRVYNREIGGFPSRIRRFWNPGRDYAREEMEQLEDVNAPWQEDKDWLKDADPELTQRRWLSDAEKMKDYRGTRSTRVMEYGQTPQGQWYAKRIMNESTSNLRASSSQMVVVHLDTEADIPDRLLDPDSLTSEMLATWGVWEAEFQKAMAILDARGAWPVTPREVAEAYWKARNAKDWDEMAVLWPGSGAWHRILADEEPVEYVFGDAKWDARSNQTVVPYASKDYYDKHGAYNLKMGLSNDKSSRGHFYITSGN